jgi:hypothetical protein
MLQKTEGIRQEQQQAIDYLQKAMPAMVKLLEVRIQNNWPLQVMRPLRYRTSELMSKSDGNDGFYSNGKSAGSDKFVDIVKTIMPGTKLMLKSIDPTMCEFIFVDGMDQEHAISFEDRNQLLTQTDLFECTRAYFEQIEKETK